MNLQDRLESTGKELLNEDSLSVLSNSFVDKITSVTDRMKNDSERQNREQSIQHRGVELFYTLPNKKENKEAELHTPKEKVVEVIKEKLIEAPSVSSDDNEMEQILQDSIKKGQELAKQAEQLSRELAAERLKKATANIASQEMSQSAGKTIDAPFNASEISHSNTVTQDIQHPKNSTSHDVTTASPSEQHIVVNTALPRAASQALQSNNHATMIHPQEKHIQKIDTIKEILSNRQSTETPNVVNTQSVPEAQTPGTTNVLSESSASQKIQNTEVLQQRNNISKQNLTNSEAQNLSIVDTTETIAPDIIAAVNAMPLDMEFTKEQQSRDNDVMQEIFQQAAKSTDSVEKIVALALNEEQTVPNSTPHIPSVDRTPLEMTHQQTGNTTSNTAIEKIGKNREEIIPAKALAQSGNDVTRIKSEPIVAPTSAEMYHPAKKDTFEAMVQELQSEQSFNTSENNVNMIPQTAGEREVISDLSHKFSEELQSVQNNQISSVASQPTTMLHPKKADSIESLVHQLEASGALAVHTDSRANKIVDEQNAKAITVDNQILMGSQFTNLSSPEVQSVLAHELTHVHQIKKAKESGEKITVDKIANFEKEAAAAQQTVMQHAIKGQVHSISLKDNNLVQHENESRKGISDTSANLINKLAGVKAEEPNERQVISAEMKHPNPAPVMQTPAATSNSMMPAMAASMDSSVQAATSSASSSNTSSASSSSSTSGSAVNIDALTEQIFMKIKDRLTVERERFHK